MRRQSAAGRKESDQEDRDGEVRRDAIETAESRRWCRVSAGLDPDSPIRRVLRSRQVPVIRSRPGGVRGVAMPLAGIAACRAAPMIGRAAVAAGGVGGVRADRRRPRLGRGMHACALPDCRQSGHREDHHDRQERSDASCGFRFSFAHRQANLASALHRLKDTTWASSESKENADKYNQLYGAAPGETPPVVTGSGDEKRRPAHSSRPAVLRSLSELVSRGIPTCAGS